MISRERLEELIKQGATIWGFLGNITKKLELNEDSYGLNYKDELVQRCYYDDYFYKLEDLFETQEEAEWHKEFGCIERTERLELPTWEEIKKDFVDNKRDCGSYTIVDRNDISIYIQVYLKGFVHIVLFGDTQYNWELTKENYTIACRKAKELFLGEQ